MRRKHRLLRLLLCPFWIPLVPVLLLARAVDWALATAARAIGMLPEDDG